MVAGHVSALQELDDARVQSVAEGGLRLLQPASTLLEASGSFRAAPGHDQCPMRGTRNEQVQNEEEGCCAGPAAALALEDSSWMQLSIMDEQ